MQIAIQAEGIENFNFMTAVQCYTSIIMKRKIVIHLKIKISGFYGAL